jgi:FeS assembly protein IscX
MNENGGNYHWLDVTRIAEELADAHPDGDPGAITFPELMKLVLALPGFQQREGHQCNERILEAIQQGWIEECAE